MSVTDTDVKLKYNGNGSTDTFAIPFDYNESDQISVYLVNETVDPVTETLQTITTHYTISGSNIVFVTAPTASQKVLIIRESDYDQQTSYTATGAFPASTHENALDYLTFLAQELKEMLSRSVLFRKSTSLSWVELPDPEAGMVLAWNADEDGLENFEVVDGNVRTDTASCSSGATSKAITFSSAYSNANYGIVTTWQNTTDANPMFQPVVITAKSASGFTVSWNVALDSANYSLNYMAIPDA